MYIEGSLLVLITVFEEKLRVGDLVNMQRV